MNEVERLRKERAEELEAANAIVKVAEAEDRDLTDEETEQIEAHTTRAGELRTEIEAAEEKAQRKAAAVAAVKAEQEHDDATQASAVSQRPNPSPSKPESNPDIVGGEGASHFRCFGEFLYAVRIAARDPGADATLERKLQAADPSGVGTVVDSEMGFLVPKEYSSRILEKMHELGTVFNLPYMKVGLTGNTYEVPYINETSRADGSRWGGVQGYWVGEANAPTASNPTVGTAELKLKKAGCLGYITSEQLEDAPATGDIMERLFAQELLFKVEDSIVRGNGEKKPLGIIDCPCEVEVSKETNQTADTLWGPNITKMWARRNPRGAANNVWLVNQDVEPYLFGLTLEGRWGSASTDVDGIPLYHPAGSITNQGEFGILMGRPVIPCEYCNTVGTSGDIILFDPSQYLLATKRNQQMRMESSIHVRFTQDEKTFRAFFRVDGQPWWSAALTPYQGSNDLSPVVVLADRD